MKNLMYQFLEDNSLDSIDNLFDLNDTEEKFLSHELLSDKSFNDFINSSISQEFVD